MPADPAPGPIADPNTTALREEYTVLPDSVERRVLRGDEVVSVISLGYDGAQAPTPAGTYEMARLQQSTVPTEPGGSTLGVFDAFSGCGGLSLGVHEAARALGRQPRTRLAVDMFEAALDVFQKNFSPDHVHAGKIEELVPGELGAGLSSEEKALAGSTAVDILIGGPPCQGHSDLNNHSRRDDPRNVLYLSMGRLAEVTRPRAVIIENVPGVVHDRSGVVSATHDHLRALGYEVTSLALTASDFGVPQRRKRHFTVAMPIGSTGTFHGTLANLRQQPLSVMHAIGDLEQAALGTNVFDTSATHSAVNKARIQYLFDNGLYELPDSERPDCHRLKPHSYKSVYGRLYPDRPAPTITSGFGSTGQGRFVHPTAPRTLTPHEAARVQGFPDYFDFSSVSGRGDLQQMIGNAVPARLGYSVALSVLATIS